MAHELIAVPFGGRASGIYWLRLYAGQVAHVAVLTEVPGNPSFSVTNGISQIASYLHERFGTLPSQLVIFVIWPRGANGLDPSVVHRVRFGQSAPWPESSRGEIEALVGAPLPELPEHGELYGRVLDLGGGTTQGRRRPIFEALAVSDLPPPHRLFRCLHAARFDSLAARTSAASVSGITPGVDIGQLFLDSLTPADIKACPRHAGGWKSIADESVRIIETNAGGDSADYVAEARRGHLPHDDLAWLVSLFRDPVDISGRAYIDGQHRACALRFSGAERAAVVRSYEELGDVSDDWIYEGDG